jgi:LacI family transcriptional regulator
MTAPPERTMAGQFINEYKKMLKKNGIKPNKDLIIHADDFSIESGYRAFKDILQKNIHFTGVITISDLLAIGIYKLSKELQFSIPDDYSIIGYDDIPITEILTPPMTTVHQPRKRIGLNSVDLLLRNIENKEYKEFKIIALSPHLVKRGSVRSR